MGTGTLFIITENNKQNGTDYPLIA